MDYNYFLKNGFGSLSENRYTDGSRAVGEKAADAIIGTLNKLKDRANLPENADDAAKKDAEQKVLDYLQNVIQVADEYGAYFFDNKDKWLKDPSKEYSDKNNWAPNEDGTVADYSHILDYLSSYRALSNACKKAVSSKDIRYVFSALLICAHIPTKVDSTKLSNEIVELEKKLYGDNADTVQSEAQSVAQNLEAEAQQSIQQGGESAETEPTPEATPENESKIWETALAEEAAYLIGKEWLSIISQKNPNGIGMQQFSFNKEFEKVIDPSKATTEDEKKLCEINKSGNLPDGYLEALAKDGQNVIKYIEDSPILLDTATNDGPSKLINVLDSLEGTDRLAKLTALFNKYAVSISADDVPETEDPVEYTKEERLDIYRGLIGDENYSDANQCVYGAKSLILYYQELKADPIVSKVMDSAKIDARIAEITNVLNSVIEDAKAAKDEYNKQEPTDQVISEEQFQKDIAGPSQLSPAVRDKIEKYLMNEQPANEEGQRVMQEQLGGQMTGVDPNTPADEKIDDLAFWANGCAEFAVLVEQSELIVKKLKDMDVKLGPDVLQTVAKVASIVAAAAGIAAMICSFIPGLDAFSIPLNALKALAGGAASVGSAAKSVQQFKKGNYLGGFLGLLGAAAGAFACAKGIQGVQHGFEMKQIHDNLLNCNSTIQNLDNQISANQAEIDQLKEKIDSDPNMDPVQVASAKDRIEALNNANEGLTSEKTAYEVALESGKAEKLAAGLKDPTTMESSKKELEDDAAKAKIEKEQAIAAAEQEQAIEDKQEATSDLKDIAKSGHPMTEAEAAKFVKDHAANGGWYANAMKSNDPAVRAAADEARKIMNSHPELVSAEQARLASLGDYNSITSGNTPSVNRKITDAMFDFNANKVVTGGNDDIIDELRKAAPGNVEEQKRLYSEIMVSLRCKGTLPTNLPGDLLNRVDHVLPHNEAGQIVISKRFFGRFDSNEEQFSSHIGGLTSHNLTMDQPTTTRTWAGQNAYNQSVNTVNNTLNRMANS